MEIALKKIIEKCLTKALLVFCVHSFWHRNTAVYNFPMETVEKSGKFKPDYCKVCQKVKR